MTQQGTIDHDPELTDAWGQAPHDAGTERRKSRRLVLWAALIGAPLAGFALWQSLGRPGATAPSTTAPVVATESSVDAAGESRRAGEAVKKFLSAATIDEASALVRHPEVTKPRMQAWYSPANPLKPRSVLEFHDRSAEQTIDGVDFLMVTMELDDHTSRSIAVEKQPDGTFLVDWESFVFWSEPRWPEFLSKEPDGSHNFRVTVQIDNYFNFGYADAKQWFCYKLEDPDRWATCWGYSSIDSEPGMKINRMIRRQLQQGQNQVKAILKLKFEPGGKGRNQVLIEDVVQDGWVEAGP